MAKKNGGLFGGLFDFNGDGKTDFGEEFIAYKLFEECMKGSDDTDNNISLDDDLDLDLIPSKDYSWRSYCEDGSEFCIFPEDYETEEEYEEALNEAKYAWRNTCEDGSDVGIFPDDYETEDEYTEALEEAKHAWRDTCEDGTDFGVDPEDYETEEEYSDALDEARSRWQNTCEDGADVGVDPDDYSTEEEYEQALEKAKAADTQDEPLHSGRRSLWHNQAGFSVQTVFDKRENKDGNPIFPHCFCIQCGKTL